MNIKSYIRKLLIDFVKSKGLDSDNINIIIERPKDEGHGDYSTNLAMVLAKQLKSNPKKIAEEISGYINGFSGVSEYISKTEIANPGFINFYVCDNYFRKVTESILEKENYYGRLDINSGKTANIEWVSANPTGPLHTGHGRQVALGRAIASLLEWSGYNVTREYYYNDAGKQMDTLAKSVYARYRQKFEPEFPFPDDGYMGSYVIDIADVLKNEYGNKLVNDEANPVFKTAGENYCFKSIKHTLERLNIQHDVFFNETSLYESGKIKETLDEFRKKGLSYEKEGAVWLKTSELIKNKKEAEDKVIVKSSGEPTYRLPDMAYHIDKIMRGYEAIIDIFGSDHGDTYREVLAGIEGLGYDTSKINVIIHQMVTFIKEGKPVKMSKRADTVYSLDDLLDDVGEDVAQFFFVMRSANTHLDFDIGLAKEQSDKNPVFYLQYAHARISGILRNSAEVFPERPTLTLPPRVYDSVESWTKGEGINIPLAEGGRGREYDKSFNIYKLNLLKEKEEIDLMKSLSLFPDVVESAYSTLEPHKIITYLNELAESYHKFYHNHRVINKDEKEVSYARLSLCEASKIVLKNGFDIIGINAPERM